MKKYIIILTILFIYNINSVLAYNVEYKKPTFWDITKYITNGDIEPWYNPQPKNRIGVYNLYIQNWIALATATKFCTLNGQTYFSHILEPSITEKKVTLYYPLQQTWWDYNVDVKKFALIVCQVWGNTTWSGTTWSGITWSGTTWTIIINNINKDPGINKSVFDDITLIEIFKYEALIMLFILLYTFLMRIFGAPKYKHSKLKGF